MTNLNAVRVICALLICIGSLLLWIGNNIAQISKSVLQILQRSDPWEVTHSEEKMILTNSSQRKS